MPRYAVISDIHGNWEAFSQVLALCQTLSIDHYLSLGDIVGYNANPHECLEQMRALNPLVSVKGNHDEYAANGDIALSGFNTVASTAIRWTREHLSEEERSWLAATPFTRNLPGNENAVLVHATLDSPQQWGYIFDERHAEDCFSYQYSQLSFCGHSHVPVAFCKAPITGADGRSQYRITEWEDHSGNFQQAICMEVAIKPGHKYLFNVGSVGQPRNRDPRASFAVYDSTARTVCRYCLPYDIRTAQEKILAAGLPERLAIRLALGA